MVDLVRYCRKREKAAKKLMSDLTQQLDNAYLKINEQAEQITTMRIFFKNFSKKA